MCTYHVIEFLRNTTNDSRFTITSMHSSRTCNVEQGIPKTSCGNKSFVEVIEVV